MFLAPEVEPLKVLIVGEGRSAIHEQAWQRGLEAAGCEVQRFDWMSRFQSRSRLRSFLLRVQDYFVAGPSVLALNAALIRRVETSHPDVLLLYRPTHVLASALRVIRQKSPATLIVSYNNDDPFSTKTPPFRWCHYLEAIPLVDVALAYREKNVSELLAVGARRVEVVRSYFLPYLDCPAELTAEDHARYDADVVFVGHYEPDGRLDALATVAVRFPGFRLFGPDWHQASNHAALMRFHPVLPLAHDDYVKAIQCAKIALVFFSSLNNDSYTRRVFEIPAIGTFMLSQRTAEMERLFRPGIEADYFSSSNELVAKIDHYLGAESERRRIAAAGTARVHDDGHDVFSRMRLLASHLREWRCEMRLGRHNRTATKG